jgi:hypothetical protein
VFIAGGGRYGSVALKYFMKQPNWRSIVSDDSETAQVRCLAKNMIDLEHLTDILFVEDPTMISGDAAAALSMLFSFDVVPEIVIPCVPFHFAAKVAIHYLTSKGLNVKPLSRPLERACGKMDLEEVESRLNEDNALLVASRMPFNLQCARNCMQTDQCPVTRRKLLKPMYTMVAETLSDEQVDIVRVLRSHLLAPSVGGFSGRDLKEAISLCIEKAPCSIAIVTSCTCHMAANVFKIDPKAPLSA